MQVVRAKVSRNETKRNETQRNMASTNNAMHANARGEMGIFRSFLSVIFARNKT
jgi:hypothetical protein